MNSSKTPKFDLLLDSIFDSLIPQTRECLWKNQHPHCEKSFEITAEDIEFLKMLRVPAPNYCPACRRMRRLTHLGMLQLFHRKCDAPDHSEMMISIFAPNCPFPVYDYKYFIGDDFDPFTFGLNVDPLQDPLSQLWSLRQNFPMPSFLNRDPGSINSDYSNGGRDTKNAYYCGGCFNSEDTWYSNFVTKSREVMDSRAIGKSDQVYQSVFSKHLYRCSFVYFSNTSSDSMFLFDCNNCTNCFGCVNLRNKSFCVFNVQYTKEEYFAFMETVYPLTREKIDQYQKQFWDLVKKLPMNGPQNMSAVNVSGVGITNSKDLYDVVDANKAQNVRHADGALTHHDSMDILFSGDSDHLYGTINIGSSSSWVKFSVSSKYTTESEFVFNCKNISNCFMCFGLQNKSFCILNKQYNEEEYFKIVDQIKSELLEKGLYGDGLGLEYSAQAYNISLGQVAFSLSPVEITRLGGYIAEEPESNIGDLSIIKNEEIPKTIEETGDDIVSKALLCELTGRPFRIIDSELQFYRKMKLPLPRVHPKIRMTENIKMAATGKKYKAQCGSCSKNIESYFNPEEGYLLYCEDCYKREVL